jgi:CRP-like cAMP-binding protein
LERLVFKDSRSRIIDFLLELSDQKGERVGFEIVLRKFMTHQELANMTATSRQTVTTVLNDLRSKDIIKFDRRRLLIRDREKLMLQLSST